MIFIEAIAPVHGRPARTADHERAPAAARGLAVLGDRDDALELLVVDDLLALRPGRAKADAHILQHALLAEEHAAAADLQRRIVDEQIGDIVPHRLVDIIAVAALQPLAGALVLDPLDACRKRGDFGGQLDSLSDAVTFGIAPAVFLAVFVSLAGGAKNSVSGPRSRNADVRFKSISGLPLSSRAALPAKSDRPKCRLTRLIRKLSGVPLTDVARSNGCAGRSTSNKRADCARFGVRSWTSSAVAGSSSTPVDRRAW